MYLKNLLLILLASVAIQANAQSICNDNLTTTEQKPCLCYCSDECGPRKNNKPGDSPFIDKETGICFCQLRDKLNYIPNQCHLRPKSEKTNCCKLPQ